jgi:hypothetical protein
VVSGPDWSDSQADSAGSIPVTRSTTKPQLTPLSTGSAFWSAAAHSPGQQLACWRRYARGAIVPILGISLLGPNLCIHCLGDGLVSSHVQHAGR